VIPGLIKKRNFNIFHAKKVLELTHQMKRQKIKDCEGKKKKKTLQWNSHQDCTPDIFVRMVFGLKDFAPLRSIRTGWKNFFAHLCS
jgi:hypothetical protein